MIYLCGVHYDKLCGIDVDINQTYFCRADKIEMIQIWLSTTTK